MRLTYILHDILPVSISDGYKWAAKEHQCFTWMDNYVFHGVLNITNSHFILLCLHFTKPFQKQNCRSCIYVKK